MAPPVNEGQILAGKYRIERVIGEGGMGVVVAATHMQLQERVALKFLLLEVSQESERATRFLREAQAAVKIKSEHVARVTDVGTLETGAPYMVMEYLDGRDLAAELERGGPMDVADAVTFVLQACEAIAEAHRGGIIHRDLKPANLFLTRRTNGSPCVKVLDFGISKIVGDAQSMTKTSATMGSPAYMSPEQLRASRNVDAHTDIWSLGVILFELLTAELPFQGNTVPELCAEILTAAPGSVRRYRPDVHETLEAVVMKCLRKDPSDRFADIAELTAALAPFASEGAASSRASVTPDRASQGRSSLVGAARGDELDATMLAPAPRRTPLVFAGVGAARHPAPPPPRGGGRRAPPPPPPPPRAAPAAPADAPRLRGRRGGAPRGRRDRVLRGPRAAARTGRGRERGRLEPARPPSRLGHCDHGARGFAGDRPGRLPGGLDGAGSACSPVHGLVDRGRRAGA